MDGYACTYGLITAKLNDFFKCFKKLKVSKKWLKVMEDNSEKAKKSCCFVGGEERSGHGTRSRVCASSETKDNECQR